MKDDHVYYGGIICITMVALLVAIAKIIEMSTIKVASCGIAHGLFGVLFGVLFFCISYAVLSLILTTLQKPLRGLHIFLLSLLLGCFGAFLSHWLADILKLGF